MPDDSNILDYAWGKILMGAVLIALAFWMNSTFTALETGLRESVRMNWMFALLYKNLGHFWTVAITGTAGAIAVLVGLRQLLSERE